MSKLQLYVRNTLLNEMEIHLPVYEKDLSFETRTTLRKWYIDAKIVQMKQMYFKQIMKYNDYEFVLILNMSSHKKPT